MILELSLAVRERILCLKIIGNSNALIMFEILTCSSLDFKYFLSHNLAESMKYKYKFSSPSLQVLNDKN